MIPPPGQIPSTSHLEAYKTVVEFNKVIVSLGSTILAVLISYLAFQDYDLKCWENLISPILLIASLILSLFGFGFSIGAINVGRPRMSAIYLSNVGAAVMFAGIGFIGFIEKEKKATIGEILLETEKGASSLELKLKPANCIWFKMDKELSNATYVYDSAVIKVTYSIKESKIVYIDRKVVAAPEKQTKDTVGENKQGKTSNHRTSKRSARK